MSTILNLTLTEAARVRRNRFRPITWPGIPTSSLMRSLTQDTFVTPSNQFLFNNGLMVVDTRPSLIYTNRQDCVLLKFPLMRVTLLQCAYDHAWNVVPWRVQLVYKDCPITSCAAIRLSMTLVEMDITDATELEREL